MLNSALAEPFDDLDRLSPEALKRWWTRKLKRVLRLAFEELPFYRERFIAAGFDPARFRTLDDLRAVPICTKDDLLAVARRGARFQLLHRGSEFADDGEPEFRHLGHDVRHAHAAMAQAARLFVESRALVGGPASRNAADHVGARVARLRLDSAVDRDALRQSVRRGFRNFPSAICRSHRRRDTRIPSALRHDVSADGIFRFSPLRGVRD